MYIGHTFFADTHAKVDKSTFAVTADLLCNTNDDMYVDCPLPGKMNSKFVIDFGMK